MSEAQWWSTVITVDYFLITALLCWLVTMPNFGLSGYCREAVAAAALLYALLAVLTILTMNGLMTGLQARMVLSFFATALVVIMAQAVRLHLMFWWTRRRVAGPFNRRRDDVS